MKRFLMISSFFVAGISASLVSATLHAQTTPVPVTRNSHLLNQQEINGAAELAQAMNIACTTKNSSTLLRIQKDQELNDVEMYSLCLVYQEGFKHGMYRQLDMDRTGE